MKNIFKQIGELFNSLSLNLQIVALTTVMGIFGVPMEDTFYTKQ